VRLGHPTAAATKDVDTRPRRVLGEFPVEFPADLKDACLQASWKIRHNRQVAYERPVVLESEYGRLTLLPITRSGSRLVLPAHLQRGNDTVAGELLLIDHDPLPLVVPTEIGYEDALAAWTQVLLGFADATCVDLETAAPLPTSSVSTSARQRASGRVQPKGPDVQTIPRRRAWPAHLQPVGGWAHFSGSFVAGHRRRLLHGETASPEARERAGQWGIVLGPSETWVRPYTRGMPETPEMHFPWTAPAELGGLPGPGRGDGWTYCSG
jgi:hypothetical protein